MKTYQFNQKRNKSPLVLFFTSYSLDQLRAYKLKSDMLTMAVKDKLCIKVISGSKEYFLNKIKTINGSFYGMIRMQEKTVEKRINISKISQVIIGGSGVEIIYNIIW